MWKTDTGSKASTTKINSHRFLCRWQELECAADAIGKLVKQLRDDIEPMVASKEEVKRQPRSSYSAYNLKSALLLVWQLQLLTRAEKDRRIAKYLSPTTEVGTSLHSLFCWSVVAICHVSAACAADC